MKHLTFPTLTLMLMGLLFVFTPSGAQADTLSNYWVDHTFDLSDKIAISDSSGTEQYIIEYGVGCLSFYEGEKILVKEGGIGLTGFGDEIILDEDDSCEIWEAEKVNLEEYVVQDTSDSEDVILITGRAGNDYIVKYGVGCLSFYSGNSVFIDIGGTYLNGIGNTIYQDDADDCSVMDAEQITSSTPIGNYSSSDSNEDNDTSEDQSNSSDSSMEEKESSQENTSNNSSSEETDNDSNSSSNSTSESSITSNLENELKYPDGTLLRSSNSGIFLIENRTKHPIPHPSVFLSHNYNWKDVVVTNKEQLQLYPRGKQLKLRDGSVVADDTSVYIIDDGERRPVKSPEVFLNAGYDWSDVKEPPKGVLNSHPEGSLISDPGYVPNGTVVYSENSSGVFLIQDGKKRPFYNPDIFLNRYSWEDTVKISDRKLKNFPRGEEVYPRSGSLLSSGGTVYVIAGRTKHPFKSSDVFVQRGYKWSNVQKVSEDTINLFSEGGLIK